MGSSSHLELAFNLIAVIHDQKSPYFLSDPCSFSQINNSLAKLNVLVHYSCLGDLDDFLFFYLHDKAIVIVIRKPKKHICRIPAKKVDDDLKRDEGRLLSEERESLYSRSTQRHRLRCALTYV